MYYIEEAENFKTLLLDVFEGLESHEFFAVTSQLTLSECLVQPITKQRNDLARLYYLALESSDCLTVSAVSLQVLRAVWDAETLEENRAWLATSLGQKGNETPQETIRRYIAGSFYKNHLQTYKKRPIYWLFSSGKQGAFQALVYLHRYNESTLSRMRAEYVVPLTGKIQSRIDMLEKDAAVASSNAEKSKLNKDIDKLKKKYVELLSFDEKLRHYADLRIQLDLDDGVKVNYGKFGDLLAEVKSVTGGKGDD